MARCQMICKDRKYVLQKTLRLWNKLCRIQSSEMLSHVVLGNILEDGILHSRRREKLKTYDLCRIIWKLAQMSHRKRYEHETVDAGWYERAEADQFHSATTVHRKIPLRGYLPRKFCEVVRKITRRKLCASLPDICGILGQTNVRCFNIRMTIFHASYCVPRIYNWNPN
jgi:hypothetical protein